MLGLLMLAGAPAARADDPGRQSAVEVSGLFIQSCLRFAGDPTGLRAWAVAQKLPALPDAGQAAFLGGRPGIAYDATDAAGKFVLVSNDDGSCSAIAQRADPDALAEALPRLLREAGVTIRAAGERSDPEETALRWRGFEAAKGERRWSIAVGTASGRAGGQAILSAAPL